MFIQPAYLPEEVAQILDVSARSVYRWLASGALKSTKCGALHRIAPHALKAFIRNRQTSTDGRSRTAWAKLLERAA